MEFLLATNKPYRDPNGLNATGNPEPFYYLIFQGASCMFSTAPLPSTFFGSALTPKACSAYFPHQYKSSVGAAHAIMVKSRDSRRITMIHESAFLFRKDCLSTLVVMEIVPRLTRIGSKLPIVEESCRTYTAYHDPVQPNGIFLYIILQAYSTNRITSSYPLIYSTLIPSPFACFPWIYADPTWEW